jgi:type I restriction enzyme R subunit
MVYTEKHTVEDFIIQELQKLGWKYIDPKEIKFERGENFEEPLIIEKLKKALKRINSKLELTDNDLNFIITSLRNLPPNVEGIIRFLDIFKNGIVIPLEKERKNELIKIVDFKDTEVNEFIVTRQFRVEGLRGDRVDVILFVNGIPLILIECKNPTREEVDWTEAYNQIKRYEDEIPELFKYIQFSIVTDGIETRYFPNAFRDKTEEFREVSHNVWRDPFPFKKEEFEDDELKIAIYGLLSKKNLLDIIENFIFTKKEKDKSVKVMARYMQFRAANKIYQRVINTLQKKENKKFGLIWHWQGSGKTYTMAFSAWKLFRAPEAEKPSIFIMVDRTDLEEQIEKDFSFIEIPIEKVGSIKKLIEILRWGKDSKRGIFLVTIEKFSPKEFMQIEEESGKIEVERENVVVLADEVHRTHYGKFETIMRSVFKNAFIFGFSGTPLSKVDRNTFQRFCPKGELYLDRYSILDSLEDGFTVKFSYEARLPEYHLDKSQYDAVAKFEEREIENLSEVEQRELRKKVKRAKALVKGSERINSIAKDIANHFKEVVDPTELKAIIVTIDREACVLYKNALDKFLPPNYSEIVMTFNQNSKKIIIEDYFKKLEEKYNTRDIKEIHNKIIDNFKTGKEPKILIVTDMLITGFDAPILWTMYLDKPLKEHRLLQAIGRTDRPFLRKKFGLIIDYIGIYPELEEAFEEFEANDKAILKATITDLSREKDKFKEDITNIIKVFKDVKKEDTYESLESALNILIDPEKAKNFEVYMKKLMNSYEMLAGDPFLKDYLFDYSWLIKVYIAYNKKFKKKNIDELRVDDFSKKTIQLIQQTINVGEIENKYPTVSIDENYIKELEEKLPRDIGPAIDILSNIQRECRNYSNSPFFINLSEEVERTYQELRNRKIKTEEAIKRILEFSRSIANWKKEEKEIGKEKYSIYEVIKSILPNIEKQKVLDFIDELLEKLKNKNLLFKGWQTQREIRRQVKIEIRILLLLRFKDYKAKIDELTEKIFSALGEVT